MGDKALQDLLSKAVELKTKGNKAIKGLVSSLKET